MSKGAFNSHLGKAEELLVKYLGFHNQPVFPIGFIFKSGVGFQNQGNAAIIQIDPLGADVLAPLDKTLAGINELHLAAAVHRLAFGNDPDVGGDACVVEQIGGKLDDGIHQVSRDDILANL